MFFLSIPYNQRSIDDDTSSVLDSKWFAPTQMMVSINISVLCHLNIVLYVLWFFFPLYSGHNL